MKKTSLFAFISVAILFSASSFASEQVICPSNFKFICDGKTCVTPNPLGVWHLIPSTVDKGVMHTATYSQAVVVNGQRVPTGCYYKVTPALGGTQDQMILDYPQDATIKADTTSWSKWQNPQSGSYVCTASQMFCPFLLN